MNDTNERRAAPLLFLKAVTKKLTWIPGYTKRDGTVVAGHNAMVNVSTDHDEHKVVSGQGTFSQKKAHAKLAKKDWFHALPHDHKVAVVLHEGTKIQDAESAAARAATFRKKILAGEMPHAGDLKGFNAIPQAKRDAYMADFKAAGKEAFFEQAKAKLSGAAEKPAEAPAKPAEPAAHEATPEAAHEAAASVGKEDANGASAPKDDHAAKQEPAKPEPTPEATPAPKPAAKIPSLMGIVDKVYDAMLPETNVNAKAENKKFTAIANAIDMHDEKTLLTMGYGSNTYGIKQVKLVNEALAAMGSKHTVTKGQKMGSHAGIKATTEAKATETPKAAAEEVKPAATEQAAATPEPAAAASTDALAMPEFAEGKEKTGVKAYYEKVAQKIIDHAAAGNLSVLEGMPTDKGQSWKGKTPNSKKLMALHAAAIASLSGNAAPLESAPADIPDTAPAAKTEPAVPELSAGYQQAAKTVKGWADKGQFDELKKMATLAGSNSDDMGKLKEYAAALYEHHTGEKAKGETPMPTSQGVDASLKADADKALAEGDMQTLKDIADYSAKNGMGPTAEYAAKHIGELAAKTAAAEAPTAPGAKPVKPMLSSITSSSIADKIEKELNAGNLAGLKAQQTMIGTGQPAETNFGKLEKYAKEAIAHLEGASTGEVGPKEGDTKQGADGMLVLRGGHWVKMSDLPDAAPDMAAVTAAPTGPSAAEAVSKLTVPKMAGKNSVKLKNKIKQLNLVAVTKGAEGLKELVSIQADGKVKVHGFVALSPTVQGNFGANALAFAQYAKQLHDAVIGAGAVGGGEAAAPKATPKAQKVVGTPTPAETESVDGWKQVGPQGGYNPGGTFEDKDGVKWYVKFPAGGEKVAKNELLATKLYALAGVEVPEVKLINQGGKIGLASKIVDGAVANKSALLEGKAAGLLQGFGADAWLANWDTVGNNPAAGKGFDNILFKPDGSAIRIDAGGALLYGGAGGKKQTFENEVTDLKTMLDPAKNANTAAVFGKMSKADIAASIAKIAAIPDHEIEGLVMEFGPGSESEKTRLAEKLIARKQNMVEQYPSAAKSTKGAAAAAKAKPDPNALPVDFDLLPKPHDYMNWQGTGKPISEKPYVKGNIADEQEILALAQQGNLTALKNYQFQPVDKMTGEAIGAKKSIDEHPSKYVQDFHSTIVSYLDMLANPPEALRLYEPKQASTLASLSAAFKPQDFGKTTAMAPKNQQIGFWIALGVADSPAKFIPKTLQKLSTAAVSAAKEAHSKLPPKVKQFISGVQGSGSYNNAYRDGKEKDSSGNSTREVLSELYNNATAHKAGTSIHKWISFAPEMIKQFTDAPEGLVFQNPGSMCTSYDATATNGFGKDRITIHYAEGAKALDSFASGSFAGEKEVTTLPGARFMVLSRKMVPDVEHGKPDGKRFELELLMLPPDPTYVENLMKKA